MKAELNSRAFKIPVRQKRRKSDLHGYWFVMLWLIGFIAFSLGPLIFSFVMSFFRWGLLDTPVFVGFRNYIDMFTRDRLFWLSLRVTLIYSGVSVPLGMILSLILAMLLNQKIKSMHFFRTIFYLPSVVSGVAVSVLWMWILQADFGVLNYFLSLFGVSGPDWLGDPQWALTALIIMSFWGIGGGMIIYLAGLQNIPPQFYEASDIDGASKWSQFWYITLPMLTPTIFFNLVTGIIFSFRTFTQGYVMTGGGPLDATMFFALHLFNQAFLHLRMGYASALAWVLFVVIMIFTSLIFKSSPFWVYYEAERRG
jgi:multiple sugar transport system permease protein